MMGIIVDIDDTLIDTDKRRWMIWCNLLNRKIPLETMERMGAYQILERFAFGDRKIWQRYWGTLFCWEEAGNDVLDLDKPIPFAAQVLQKWREKHMLIYLTGRSNNMRRDTLDELERFGFPTDVVDLVMLSVEDWESYFESKMSPTKLRARLFSLIAERYKIFRVVDDYPIFFPVYSQFKVPDRIGLLRPKRFLPQDYFNQGATRVTTWQKLMNEI